METDNQRRREITQYYIEHIENTGIILLRTDNSQQSVANDRSNVWHMFVVRNSNRDILQKHLEANGVQMLIHYPIPPHKQSEYQQWNHLSFPITEQIHQEVLSLPMSAVLKATEMAMVAEAVNSF